jgi:hypothetical protein
MSEEKKVFLENCKFYKNIINMKRSFKKFKKFKVSKKARAEGFEPSREITPA